jgi:hypothetical protein
MTRFIEWETPDGRIPEEYREQVPRELLEGLDRYVREGYLTGGFLQAVLAGDLFDAVGRAHPDSLRALKPLVNLLQFFAPSAAYGSRGAIDLWVANHPERLRRERSELDAESEVTP